MKRFMYLSVGVFCLALATLIGFHIGQGTAGAQGMTGFRVLGSSGNSLLVAVGENIYYVEVGHGSWQIGAIEERPPVQVSNLVFFNGLCAITDAGEGWWSPNYRSWQSVGFLPTGPTAVQSSTWSEIKAKFAPPK